MENYAIRRLQEQFVLNIAAEVMFDEAVKYMESEDGVTTFKPLTQNKNSNQKYNGPGFIPCNGLLPCQLDHFPAEYNQQRKEGQMAEWNGVEG